MIATGFREAHAGAARAHDGGFRAADGASRDCAAEGRIAATGTAVRAGGEAEAAETTQPLIFGSQAPKPAIRFASETEVREALGAATDAEPKPQAAAAPVVAAPVAEEPIVREPVVEAPVATADVSCVVVLRDGTEAGMA